MLYKVDKNSYDDEEIKVPVILPGTGLPGYNLEARGWVPGCCTWGQGSVPFRLGRRFWQSYPQLPKLAFGTQNVASLVGKGPKLVHKVLRYSLNIAGLAQHIAQALELVSWRRAWLWSCPKRWQPGVDMLVSPWFTTKKLRAFFIG